MEGRISKEFFKMQEVYLTLGCHKLNGEQWVKQCIGKILHITHSQWIFKNFTLHDKQKGWLRRKDMKDIMREIENLWDTDVDDIPEDSRFLLEMDYMLPFEFEKLAVGLRGQALCGRIIYCPDAIQLCLAAK